MKTLSFPWLKVSLATFILLLSIEQTNCQSKSNVKIGHGVSIQNIGPTVMSGRVVDLDVNPDEPWKFFVAYASGGLWYTENNGTTFNPLFQFENSMTIGDIAVDWERGTVWLGSGESNSSRSSYAGDGIYVSYDMGHSWSHKGLNDTHHIGRIILHPSEPNTLWVAAIGHLYSKNEERGVFKSTDAGESWEKVLYVNDSTGVIDMVIDPQNPSIIYAASWERSRYAWNFKGNGIGSGIHKSEDGGTNWKRITNENSGFPSNDGVGRIGLAVSSRDSNLIFVLLDNQNTRPEEDKKVDELELTKEKLRTMGTSEFGKLENAVINDFLDKYGFPKKYDAESIKRKIDNEEISPITLVEYLEDANALLFDTEIKGAEFYVSNDGGTSWSKPGEKYIDDLYYTYGYYFGNIRVSPLNDSTLYILGVPVLRSNDRGKTWKSVNGDNVHVDHHALWINPKNDAHIILGNDGGVNISYDFGESWIKCNSIPVGQFYAVNVDKAENYHVYGGLQDNGVWKGPGNYKGSNRWHSSGKYFYQELLGGDGMQVAIDTRDNKTVYTGFQFGNYYRIDAETGKRKKITPVHELGQRPYRFNWQTPVHLSRHNQDVLYLGSNFLHRSLDQGDTWQTMSDDLTRGGKQGNVPFGTLTCIEESPMRFGLLYVGSDDGKIHASMDGGYTWTDISDGLPDGLWVSRLEASNHEEGRLYATLNGYRNDDMRAYIYKSDNYGKSWESIAGDLPKSPINVVVEDLQNDELLYVGTDNGAYYTLDAGKVYALLSDSLPRVAVHDLVVQPEHKELIVGTHGRSIYKVDIKYLQQLSEEILDEDLFVFDIPEIHYKDSWGKASWSKWLGYNEPELEIDVFSKNGGECSLTILNSSKMNLNKKKIELSPGLNRLVFDMTISANKVELFEIEVSRQKNEPFTIKKSDNEEYYIPPGEYILKFSMGNTNISKDLNVKEPKKSERGNRNPQVD